MQLLQCPIRFKANGFFTLDSALLFQVSTVLNTDLNLTYQVFLPDLLQIKAYSQKYKLNTENVITEANSKKNTASCHLLQFNVELDFKSRQKHSCHVKFPTDSKFLR